MTIFMAKFMHLKCIKIGDSGLNKECINTFFVSRDDYSELKQARTSVDKRKWGYWRKKGSYANHLLITLSVD